MFPTLIASIFGMNLINGMETSWWGFPLVIVSSIVVTATFYWLFRRRSWV
jgi:magnesium transporter